VYLTLINPTQENRIYRGSSVAPGVNAAVVNPRPARARSPLPQNRTRVYALVRPGTANGRYGNAVGERESLVGERRRITRPRCFSQKGKGGVALEQRSLLLLSLSHISLLPGPAPTTRAPSLSHLSITRQRGELRRASTPVRGVMRGHGAPR
jgi:hypothetical protein